MTQMKEWIARYWASHKDIPEGHYDGEVVAELIRCKDCKHMGEVYLVSLPWLEQKEHRCRYWEHQTTLDDYCSRAERKEE